jgi:hypothetical protein
LKVFGVSLHMDGRVLRTGSANLSAAVLKQQANDVLVARDAFLVEKFTARFERLWEAAKPVPKSDRPFHGSRRRAPAPPLQEGSEP